VIGREGVLAAVAPAAAVERTRDAFVRHARGEWEMPPKLYVDSPPGGDFRAMPARGGGFAILKWVTSFPENPARGLPVVAGALLLSSTETGALLAIIDCASVTSLRTGAVAALSAQALARDDARRAGIIGCGVNRSWAGRCLAAIGYSTGACADVRPDAAVALAEELGWDAGTREDALACGVVVTITPGARPVVDAGDPERLRPRGGDARLPHVLGIYSGMLPCLRCGWATRLVCRVRSARISFGRVSCGSITSSM